MPALQDARYIRVDGRPLLIIYRAMLLPDAGQSAARWREEAARAGLPGLYLCLADSFGGTGNLDPASIGFDAVVEFPPHGANPLGKIPRVHHLCHDFKGSLVDYRAVAAEFAQRPAAPFRRFRGVMPAWDNTARMGKKARIFVNASPEAYGEWLRQAMEKCRDEAPPGERLVFINAWNEWAEGCHLEPDTRYGNAWLTATLAATQACAPAVAHALENMPANDSIRFKPMGIGLSGWVRRWINARARWRQWILARRSRVLQYLSRRGY